MSTSQLLLSGNQILPINLVISADQVALYNMFTQAGSPTYRAAVTVTVNAGKVCQAGMTMGAGWPAGCTFALINNGRIAGLGGAGSAGGDASAGTLSAGTNGVAGGDALTLTAPITITNGSGEIFGGGGGAGGGGAAAGSNPPGANASGPGGGGAGGQGYNNPGGGAAGISNGNTHDAASAGTAGSSAGAGVNGVGGVGPANFLETYRTNGGRGGDGAPWGNAGTGGVAGTLSGSGIPGGAATTAAGGGGAAGNAVRTNGFAITWISGSTPPNTAGPIG